MHRRFLHRILVVGLVALFAGTVFAAPRDKAANKKIDEAINQHYFATDFEKAEAILLGTIKACEDKCSPEVLGRAYMYVGLVRGSGKSDMDGAKEAFMNAIALDPKVKFDDAIANDATKKAWAEIAGTAPPPSGGEDPPPSGGEDPPPAGDVVGDMECSLEVREVETNRAIPLECTTDEDANSAEIRYKAFGSEKWEKIKMRKRGDAFRGTIPCEASELPGDLKFYVRARDSDGVVDQFGKKSQPIVVKIVRESDEDPPSFPDKDEPDRCEGPVECPPDFPGCEAGGGGAAVATRPTRGSKGWGSTCEEDIECEAGLACVSGSCEEGQSCDSDTECVDGLCIDGTCARGAELGGGGGGPSGPYKKFWLGLHVAQDLAFISGDQVCSFRSQDNDGWSCFYQSNEVAVAAGANPADPAAQVDIGGEKYLNPPVPGTAGLINGGLRPATTRFLVSFDFAALDVLTVGIRGGLAINGNPESFLPVHAEARGHYYPLGTPRKGFRPYLHLGAGMAQVDASISVMLRDCGKRGGLYRINPLNGGTPTNPDEPAFFPDPALMGATDPDVEAARLCGTGQVADAPSLEGSGLSPDEFDAITLTAYKQLGQGFATLGGGIYYGIIDPLGLQLNLNVMIMLPDSGVVLQPSLGLMYGF